MPVKFQTVPNWQSWENQGGSVALADLDRDGISDLVVLRVDRPGGQNRGFYRVGHAVSPEGDVAVWDAWQEVPDWFARDNQGAGIAVADLSGSSQFDLIVFLVENGPQENRGIYRIGKNLDAQGKVTGGWTPWIDVPGWDSWNNQGASIAVGNFNTSGQNDLLVFRLDEPGDENRGFYRIGRNLNANGVVTGGWSAWKEVPNWFSWENQAGGVATRPSTTAGQHDVYFFHIDNAATQNQAFFKIARGMDGNGNVNQGWSPWLGVPGWFSWENQGGDIAIGNLQSGGVGSVTQDMVILGVDNPPGANAGFYQVLPLNEDQARHGKWEQVSYLSDILPVHAALLPTGKVLFFAGSGNSAVRFGDSELGNVAKGKYTSVVWDYTKQNAAQQPFDHPNTLFDAQGRALDMFCCGEAFLSDGRLLVAGGTKAYDVDGNDNSTGHGFFGRRDTQVFDSNPPPEGHWTVAAKMADGRWYPTLISLEDGKILAVAGLDENGNPNQSLEVFTPNATTGVWRTLPNPIFNAIFDGLPAYAHIFLLRDGRIFFSGGRMDDDRNTPPCLLNLKQNPVGVTPINGLRQADARNQSASVLLAPAQEQKILVIGGATVNGEQNAIGDVDLIDLSVLPGQNPVYQAAAPLLLPRIHVNAVLLPDHTVFVSGGALQREGGAPDARKVTARFQSEIYHPDRDQWDLSATAHVERMYHSIALLLPDGRVMAASGNPDKGHKREWQTVDHKAADPNEELRLEIYSPPYLFKGPRPSITAAPKQVTYGEDFQISSPATGNIKWVSFIRNGVTTHSFDSNQRIVDLNIATQEGTTISVTAPQLSTLAPPGYYMLFIIDNSLIPSIAEWIRLQ